MNGRENRCQYSLENLHFESHGGMHSFIISSSLYIVTFKINHQRAEWEEPLIVTQDLHHEANAETKLWPLCLFTSTSLFINSFIVEQNSLRSSKSPS